MAESSSAVATSKKKTKKVEVLKLQPKQEAFVSTKADIAIFGGGAGGGKSHGLLTDPLQWMHVPGYSGVIFRREYTQIHNEGGLWSEAERLYTKFGATSNISKGVWQFKNIRVRFAHLQHEKSKYAHQGGQYAFIGFDELTHFTASQFWYLASRNRSTCGVRPYIRATTNPENPSWVRDLIDWWIDKDGFPIRERAGVLRYFIRIKDAMVWADTAEELVEKYPDAVPRSLTFIPSLLEDNPALMEKDPGYKANLASLPLVERERLEKGNWLITYGRGNVLRREWFKQASAFHVKQGFRMYRFWDLAATEQSHKNPDPDYVATCLLVTDGFTYWAQFDRDRLNWPDAKAWILRTAKAEPHVTVGVEQEPGASGKALAIELVRDLLKYTEHAHAIRPQGDKVARANRWAPTAENGGIILIESPDLPLEVVLSEFHAFPDAKHDDLVDAMSGAWTLAKAKAGQQAIVIGDITNRS